MGFSKQEFWSGLPCPPPEDLPDSEIELMSLSLLHCQADSLPLLRPGKPIHVFIHTIHKHIFKNVFEDIVVGFQTVMSSAYHYKASHMNILVSQCI